jgi:hypothetical protein
VSLSVVFHGAPDGGDGPFSLASSSGWQAFGKWAASLPPKFAAVKALAKDGEFKGTDELSRQLSAALKARPPKEMVAHTVKDLLGNLGVGDPGETATVTDDHEGGDDE